MDRDLLACMRDLEYMPWNRIAQFFSITPHEARLNYEAAPLNRKAYR